MSCCKPIPETPPLCRKKEGWPLSRSSLFHAEEPAQQAPQGLGRLPDNDSHGTSPLSAAAATAAAAGDEKERDQKQQRPHRKDGRDKDPGPQGDGKDPKEVPAAVPTKHPVHAPFLCPSISGGTGGGNRGGKDFCIRSPGARDEKSRRGSPRGFFSFKCGVGEVQLIARAVVDIRSVAGKDAAGEVQHPVPAELFDDDAGTVVLKAVVGIGRIGEVVP